MSAAATKGPQADPRECLRSRQATRLFWVDLEPGKRLQLTRPHEADWRRFSASSVELVASYVVGWDGITDADLRGAAIGTGDPMPFDADLCLDVLRDSTDWASAAQDGLIRAINAHAIAKAETAKNSRPS